jgi:hypothetical protein
MTYPQQGQWVPRALFGAPLEGSNPVRYVYLDEAGTSANEPVSVVAGVIIHPDTQWRAVESAIHGLFDEYVPSEFREEFVFHALQVFGGGELRDKWPKDMRWALLDAVVSLPRRFHLPIPYGIVRRFAPTDLGKSKLTIAEAHHAIAFHTAVGSADRYLRWRTPTNEVATLVVEDVPEMRQVLNQTLEVLKHDPFLLLPEHIRHDVTDITTEQIVHGEELKVTRIVDTPHFVPKKGAPLLQIADACAFAVRRWASGQTRGDHLMRGLLGMLPAPDEFNGPATFGYWGVD